MRKPFEITFRHVPLSPSIAELAREKASKLEQFYDGVTSCRAVIEAPTKRHRHGQRFHVRVELGVPGEELVVGRDAAKEDLHVAVAEAFGAARRQLQDYLGRKRARAHAGAREGQFIPPVLEDDLDAPNVTH